MPCQGRDDLIREKDEVIREAKEKEDKLMKEVKGKDNMIMYLEKQLVQLKLEGKAEGNASDVRKKSV